MRNSFERYSQVEEEQRKKLGPSKPIVARAVARNLGLEESSPPDAGWSNFIELKKILQTFELM